MKILYVTTVGITMIFFKNLIKALTDSGNTVDIITNNADSPVPVFYNDLGCKVYSMDSSRSPFSINNFKAYKQLKKHLETHKYDIIHCHTPIAAAITRLAAKKIRKKGAKIIYTAHGFHFYKGAPLKNWLIYFPVEWLCSFMTDKLITINKEDFEFSKKHLHPQKTIYIPGVGIDSEYFSSREINSSELRKKLGISEDNSILLSVGELNDNKNHETVIKAIAELKIKNITYLICGKGNKKEYLQSLANSLAVEKQVIFAGHRSDIADIYKLSDIFVFPSKREGLPVSLMEAMAAGLPCIASDIRGCKDLIKNGKNGFLCNPLIPREFSEKILFLLDNAKIKEAFAEENKTILKPFSIKNILKELETAYFKS